MAQDVRIVAPDQIRQVTVTNFSQSVGLDVNIVNAAFTATVSIPATVTIANSASNPVWITGNLGTLTATVSLASNLTQTFSLLNGQNIDFDVPSGLQGAAVNWQIVSGSGFGYVYISADKGTNWTKTQQFDISGSTFGVGAHQPGLFWIDSLAGANKIRARWEGSGDATGTLGFTYAPFTGHSSGTGASIVSGALVITGTVQANVISAANNPVWITGNIGGTIYSIGQTAATTATIATLAYTTVATQFLANNPNRNGLSIYNKANAELFLSPSASVSANTFSWRIAQRSEFELPSPAVFQGAIWGVWAAGGTGQANITEFLAPTASIAPMPVVNTSGTALWVTGNVALVGPVSFTGTIVSSEASVASWGGLVPGAATLISGMASGNLLIPVLVDSYGAVHTTGNIGISGPITGVVGISGPITGVVGISGPATVTSTFGNPVWITGSVTQVGEGNVAITASIPITVTATAGFPVWITGSVTQAGSGDVRLTGVTVTIPVSATNPVNVANFPANVNTVPLVPNPTQFYPVRLTDGTNYYNSTGGGSGSGGGTTVVVVPPKTVALTGTLSRISQNVAAVTLLGGNPTARLGFTIFNSSSQGLGVSYTDATAVSAAFKIGPYSVYEGDAITFGGTIYGLWDASGTGAAFVTEYTGQNAITGTLAVTQGSGSASTTLYPWMVTFPSYNMSAFGALRTAPPYTLLDLVNKYGIDNFELSTSGTGGSTIVHVPNEACIRLQTDGASGSASRIRTNTFFRYQAGRGQRIITTCVHDASQAGQSREWGYFDTNDGLLWCLSGTDFGFKRRSSTSGAPVDVFISQSAFNLDKFDGTGPSQQNLDITKGNIYEIDFQWLGVGVVNLFINGLPIHTIQNPNTLPTVYMKTAVLPVGATVKNEAVTTSGSGMKFICANVTSEGGQNPPEYGFSYSRSALKTAIANTGFVPVMSFRLQDVFPSGSTNDNRAFILPTTLQLYAENAASNKTPRCDWELVLNPTTLTGPTWVNVDVSSSCVQRSETATAYTGGTVIAAGKLQTNPNGVNAVLGNTVTVDLNELFSINARKMRRGAFNGTSDVLTLVCQSTSADNINVDATIAWQEVR